MSWLTLAWSTASAASLTLALIELFAWRGNRKNQIYLRLSLMAFGAAGCGFAELFLMKTTSAGIYGEVMRWQHIPVFVLLVSLVWVIQLHLGTGRRWLAITFTALWSLALTINFLSPINLVFSEITSLETIETRFGESYSLAKGIPKPWVLVSHLATLALIAYIADASWRLWRTGNRRRALTIGGGSLFFIIFAGIHSGLVDTGIVRSPYMISFSFIAIALAVALELGSDVMRAKELALEVAATHQRWNDLLATLPMFVVGLDPDGRINFANPYLLEAVGLEKHALLGKPLESLASPRHAPGIRENLKFALEGGQIPSRERPIITAGGEELTGIWTTITLRDPDGNPTGTLGIATDVTERVKAERELQAKRKELDHLTRIATMGELAASLAHELNQPLTAISNNAAAGLQMLRQEPLDLTEFRELLEDVCSDGKRAGLVIHSLKDLSRKQVNGRDNVKLNHLVINTLKLTRPAAELLHCDILSELDSRDPLVHAQAVQIEQVLLNLIVNAFDALKSSSTPDPRVCLETRCENDDSVWIEVRDNGPGLPADEPNSIFNQFYSTKQDGMGMGLSIARSIVELHGGRISARNHPDGGACFRFTLPLQPPGSA